MNKRDATKFVVGKVVGYGSGVITYGIIKSNVAPTNIYQKVGMAVASFAIGGAVADAAINQSDAIIDDIFDGFDKFKEQFEK